MKIKNFTPEQIREIKWLIRQEVNNMEEEAAEREETAHAEALNSIGDTYGSGD